MKSLFCLFASLIFSLLVLSQTREIDSLKKNLEKNNTDTSAVENLNWLSWLYCSRCNYDSALMYADKGIHLANKLSYSKGVLAAYINFGNVYYKKNNYPLTLKNYLSALSLADSVKSKTGLSHASNNVGTVLFDQGNYADALKYFLQSLKIKEDESDSEGVARTYFNIGIIYEKMGDYSKAKINFDSVMVLELKCKDTLMICSCYNYLVLILLDRRNYDEALRLGNQTLEFCLKHGNSSLISDAYEQLGLIYSDLGNINNAVEYYQKSYTINEELGDRSGIAEIDTYLGLLLFKQNKLPESDRFLYKALLISDSIGDKEVIKNTYLLLSRVDSASGNFANALKEYQEYTVYKDSINNEENTRKMVSEQMTYEFEKQMSFEKAEQGKKAARQRIVRNGFMGGFGFALVFAGVFFFQRKRISKERDRSDSLLLNILPAETAEELKITGESKARNYPLTTVMFTDFKSFTVLAEKMAPAELINELNYCFKEFDKIIFRHNVEKIKTMGDGYMAAGGVPVVNSTNPQDTVEAALEIQGFMEKMKSERESQNRPYFEARIGIHSGPVVAGIVGIKKFAYDIWGDTVNIASRMESSGEAGKINISGATFELVKDKFTCTYRGKIEAKNKGEIDMYFVDNRK
jgi:adenylate cyclase